MDAFYAQPAVPAVPLTVQWDFSDAPDALPALFPASPTASEFFSDFAASEFPSEFPTVFSDFDFSEDFFDDAFAPATRSSGTQTPVQFPKAPPGPLVQFPKVAPKAAPPVPKAVPKAAPKALFQPVPVLSEGMWEDGKLVPFADDLTLGEKHLRGKGCCIGVRCAGCVPLVGACCV